MKKLTPLAAAVLALLASPVGAATFSWTSGNFIPGTTAPSPLTGSDILEISTGSAKSFASVAFVNSATVRMLASSGAVGFASNASVQNNGLWDFMGDSGLSYIGGAPTSFNNAGTLRKSGGTGVSTLGAGNFGYTQSGTIEALTGTVRLSGGPMSINAGSVFTGAGTVEVAASATFNGSFDSSNLVFTSGTQTGNGAVLNGTVTMNAGTLAGAWQVASGQNLVLATGSSKSVSGAGTVLTNEGTVTQASVSSLSLATSASIVNNGVWDLQTDSGLSYVGGPPTSFNNAGTLRKSAGTGVSTLGAVNFGYTQSGTIDAQTGTVRLSGGPMSINSGSVFTGAGTVEVAAGTTFNGSFDSSNLVFTGGTQTGNSAVLNGSVTMNAGTLAGTWQVAAGQNLVLATGGFKVVSGPGTVLTNEGTVVQSGDSGNISLASGAAVANNGVWDLQTDSGLSYVGGPPTSFNNAGTLRKSGGTGISTLGAGNFGYTQSGTIDAQTGTVRLSGGPMSINAGSVFTGAGTVEVAAGTTFNGSFDSSNLVFTSGIQTGNSAVLNGSVTMNAGTLAGTWQVASGQNLVLATGGFKVVSGPGTVLTNEGTVVQSGDSGNISLASGAAVANNGVWNIQNDSDVVYVGGAATSFVNAGTLVKSAGGGTSTFNSSGLVFSNTATGTVDVQQGTLALPASFTNAGTLKGDGTFSSGGTGLLNNGAVAPGSFGVGTLALIGAYTQSATGSFAVDLTNLSSSDLFNITGAATLDGTLALNCLGACSFAIGDSFTILDASTSLMGSFASVTLSGFATGAFSLVYDLPNASVSLLVTDTVTAVPEPGTAVLILAGLAIVGQIARRRRRA